MSTRPAGRALATPDIVDLKRQLSDMLSLEETDTDVDWPSVAARAEELLPHSADLPSTVVHYLNEVGRRQSDPVFAHAQRAGLLSFLRGAS